MYPLVLRTLTLACALVACSRPPASRATEQATGSVSAGAGVGGSSAAGVADPPPAGAPDSIPVSISADVGRKHYTVAGLGECVRELRGTVHDAPAEMWAARWSGERDGFRHMNLVLWRLKDGSGITTSLYLQIGETTHKIATVVGGEIVGQARAELQLSGQGGSLVVNGVDGDGVPIRITAHCERFPDNTEQNG
jgi:hypothetical protein